MASAARAVGLILAVVLPIMRALPALYVWSVRRRCWCHRRPRWLL